MRWQVRKARRLEARARSHIRDAALADQLAGETGRADLSRAAAVWRGLAAQDAEVAAKLRNLCA